MSRGKRYAKSELEKKKILYITGVVVLAVLLVLIFTLSGYKNKEEAKQKIAELEKTESFDASLVSQSEDKNITEVIEENQVNETEKIAINTSNATVTNTTNDNIAEQVQVEPVKKELKFIVPLEGEIYKDYSESTLIYSETLEEWTVHLGVDIKAEKGTPVVAAEDGTVESIKNDPRYGLTVIIEHENGFKTIYSNLQTAEFVQEGQAVEKGKTIASVGENASFEISEGAHLHFEMTKDGEKVNPTIYWNK